MFTSLKRAAALVLSALLPSLPLAASAASVPLITDQEEFHMALGAMDEGSIGGVAFSADFAKHHKGDVQRFVLRLKELQDRPVFLYGPKLDPELAKEVLGESCAGYIPLQVVVVMPRSQASTVVHCTAGPAMSEEKMREHIREEADQMERYVRYVPLYTAPIAFQRLR